MQRFFDLPHTHWRWTDRCLHLDAVPEFSEEVLIVSSNASNALRQIRGIEVQPLQSVHVTLQRLDSFQEDLHGHQWQAFLADAPVIFAQQQPFELTFEKPGAMSHAMKAVAEGGLQWEFLIAGIRQTILKYLPTGVLKPAPLVPHYTVAYCTEERTDELVAATRKDTGMKTRMRVREVSLVSVTQFPQHGRFTFDVLERWPLGDRYGLSQTEPEQEPVQ